MKIIPIQRSLIVSVTLSGYPSFHLTIKYPSFRGICFFDEIFSFFNLVSSDLFSKLNFIKTGFYLLLKGTDLVM